MDVICGTCELVIRERCVTCSGGCISHFHMACVGLNAIAHSKSRIPFHRLPRDALTAPRLSCRVQTLVNKIDALVDTIAVLSSNLPKKKT
jgi:hypothetical protein